MFHPNHWAKQWIETLYNSGLTGGCGNGNYCPGAIVTRGQMAVFLLRGIHGSSYFPPAADGTMFDDVPSDHWAAAWIEQVATAGITAGCGNGRFCPEDAVTRDQMAVLLLRASKWAPRSLHQAHPARCSATFRESSGPPHGSRSWLATTSLAAVAMVDTVRARRSRVIRWQYFSCTPSTCRHLTSKRWSFSSSTQNGQEHGLAPLTAQPQLAAAASAHSADMADNDYFSHDSQDGSTFVDRIERQGYSWRAGAREYCRRLRDARSRRGGMDEQPRPSREYSRLQATLEIGVGYAHNPASTYGAYWTADFARPR